MSRIVRRHAFGSSTEVCALHLHGDTEENHTLLQSLALKDARFNDDGSNNDTDNDDNRYSNNNNSENAFH
jgi:hypothetical protein